MGHFLEKKINRYWKKGLYFRIMCVTESKKYDDWIKRGERQAGVRLIPNGNNIQIL